VSLIESPFIVTPVNGDTPFPIPGTLEVVATIIPPGVAIVMSAPPFTITLSIDATAALVDALLAAIA
jgi:hypothetical protein